ncbi:hypothetical protein AB1Y20_014805 [Prymnesium parvum]|uniref:Uncharacterized protein n=1 Tax=Prymnesium parvum TaxID=97485 RepID=A0AB34IF51_PRYPA
MVARHDEVELEEISLQCLKAKESFSTVLRQVRQVGQQVVVLDPLHLFHRADAADVASLLRQKFQKLLLVPGGQEREAT